MASRPYVNFRGKTFTADQRSKMAVESKRKRREEGGPVKPEECDLCGQDDGILMWHNEDYDHPSDDIWGLCWRCHMIWHSRARCEGPTREYFKEVLNGKRWPPVYKHDWLVLARDHKIFGRSPKD